MGSEMCIRDSLRPNRRSVANPSVASKVIGKNPLQQKTLLPSEDLATASLLARAASTLPHHEPGKPEVGKGWGKVVFQHTHSKHGFPCLVTPEERADFPRSNVGGRSSQVVDALYICCFRCVCEICGVCLCGVLGVLSGSAGSSQSPWDAHGYKS